MASISCRTFLIFFRDLNIFFFLGSSTRFLHLFIVLSAQRSLSLNWLPDFKMLS
jgi:hypothetical protein